MRWILLISTAAVVYCRPQYDGFPSVPSSKPLDGSSIEIKGHDVIELNPYLVMKPPAKIEDDTQEILKKIAEVNQKHGLVPKKATKPSFQHFPYSSFRSQGDIGENRKGNDFKFARDPFTNPILDFVDKADKVDHPSSLKSGNPNQSTQPNYIVLSRNGPEISTDIKNEQVPEGHFIKRKITHQQTVLVPSPAFFNQNNMMQQPFMAGNGPNFDNKMDLEKQTIDNIKNIVGNTQMPMPMYSGYYQNPQVPLPYYPVNNNYYRLHDQFYGPSGRQIQWPQWPLAPYFPIVIKDPMAQMINAFTTMVEYGPQATMAMCGKPAKTKENQEQARDLNNSTTTRNSIDSSSTVFDVDDVRIIDKPDVKDNVIREAKQVNATNLRKSSKFPMVQSIEIEDERANPFFNFNKGATTTTTTEHQLPDRDRPLNEDELTSSEENDKAENVQLSHDGNKKLFSKDNTGSGIFIHKLKVRKGGVAIAGPGGIATAGSGGTAIVGPNGFAYTQPNSLAIAGSGSQVVAVEPSVNLSDFINNANITKGHHQRPPRIGKVVAVGPVIYYNKGRNYNSEGETTPSKVTILPFYGGGKGQALQIVEKPDGTVTTTIIQRPPNAIIGTTTESAEETIVDTSDLEYPPLPTKQDQQHAYGENIKNIHQTALNIIKLQETAKQNGKLSENEELVYKENLDSLNLSAQKLAKLQEEESDYDFENREGLSEWFERKKTTKKDKDKKKEEDRKRKEEEERKKKLEEEEKRKKEEEDKKKKPDKEEEEEEEVGENEEEGIAIDIPSDEASVAEAKPVGLAVAGEGGVAASKPIATAVVGPGGLAIARPVGTAIAGVSPDQALVPIYAEGYIASTKPKRRGGGTKSDSASEYLNKIISKYHQI